MSYHLSRLTGKELGREFVAISLFKYSERAGWDDTVGKLSTSWLTYVQTRRACLNATRVCSPNISWMFGAGTGGNKEAKLACNSILNPTMFASNYDRNKNTLISWWVGRPEFWGIGSS